MFPPSARQPVLEEAHFVDKQCLARLGLRVSIPYAMRVTFNGTDYNVVVGWVGKGRGRCVMFRCPLTGRMAERLYPMAGQLVSRHALGLKYASQVRGQVDVLDAKADRLRRSLQDPLHQLLLEDGVPMPAKPKGMRWPRYWAKVEKLEAIQRQLMAFMP